MLGEHYRFHIVNNGGATVQFSTDGANNSFTIDAILWKFDSNGEVVHSTETELFADPSADLSDGSSAEGSSVDNSSNHYIGAECIAIFESDATLDGTIDIYYEQSTDGGTTFPSDAADFQIEEDLQLVASIRVDTNEDRSINFSI